MDAVRIGVFVCRCGTNIGGFLDVPALVAYAQTLPDVVSAQENLYTCAEAGLTAIQTAIVEQQLTRVIVASCTPRTHEPLFRATCAEAGLNPYLFEFVNIREQCSWTHMREPALATIKAKDLIRMGVARARLLEPQESLEVPVVPAALVIGGGIAGLTSALNLATRGFEVTLVERAATLGGRLRDLYRLAPTGVDAAPLLAARVKAVTSHRNVEVLTEATVVAVHGFVGNYDVTVRQGGRDIPFRAGVIVVATGAAVWTPTDQYGYDGARVLTQLELAQRLRDPAYAPARVVMIQCVGARTPERPYCARVCCATALHHALLLLARNPAAQVTILYRDMQSYGTFYEALYTQARERGVLFVKYAPERPPRVEADAVVVVDAFLDETLRLPYDRVVLSTPMVAQPDAATVAQLLKVPLDAHGFFLEAHVKLRPVDFATDGVYLCGAAHWPVSVGEAVAQAYGAASRASIPLARGHVIAEPIVAEVTEDKCVGCGLCELVCPYKAIRVEETPKGRIARTIVASCKGCGVCGASCPEQAITMRHFKDDQMLAEIIALAGET
jgi:heterodisulfide reductase subunit A